ncbi:ABC transporter ATP-binding protein [Thermosipho africanus H17ap60334]|jgi:lipopolysaccharide export system ATP-binding protein|uniref:LPS export ABC transporter ATP-binding protein n=1 Tax=Thermosipho africanus TaxID=2421 RepID=UPI00028C8C4F|nr:LPS export ABC transporter ATP-binding protein [Thermosipho africanus]EKF50086.1 ABC transporter ATP-binding protein [Thermosipho africanus H17ap60334]MDK2839378.1 lipopolysaccharide export system ATP-binding protein [Thermosipho sp. (in: thermotogales)]MDK2899737.1 lipopolysaccharide export system ATP-binding protein [Thermosipho sp. (in: thermotogales)]
MEIVCKDVKKRFGRKQVLNGINLNVRTGEVVGLLGPNGSGKTTLFNIILGVVIPSSGKIYLGEKDITKIPIHKRAKLGITYLQQETSVFRQLSVEDNLKLVIEYHDKDVKKIPKLLKEFGIDSLKDQYAFYLSGGEKRRLELARMMILSPKFLLLDEPFVGIDPKTVKEIQKMVISLKERGIGIIITDHSVDALKDIVDRLYVIHKGDIIASGQPEEVLNDETVKEVYLGG